MWYFPSDMTQVCVSMQELVEAANRLLLGNRGILSQLENKAGLRPTGSEQTHEVFRAAMQEWSDRVGQTPEGPWYSAQLVCLQLAPQA